MAQKSKTARLPPIGPLEQELRTREKARKRAPPKSGKRASIKLKQSTARFKLALIGDFSVGKSSLALRYIKDRFYEFEEPTIGAAFLSHMFAVDKTTVKYEIWDTAGQERYRGLIPVYCRGAHAVLVVYDISDETSFEGAKNWLRQLEQETSPNRVVALLGNKADLASKREVDYEVAKSYAEEKNILFMETSAKMSINVDEIFLAVAKGLLEKFPSKQQDSTDKGGEVSISFEQPDPPSGFRRFCCI